MLGYATYQNESVVIVRVIDTGSAAGDCLIQRPNGTLAWVSYLALTVHNWVLTA